MTSSLIISTYNRPDALEVCLKSVMELRTFPDEVIVGDDGSGPDTRAVVEKYQKIFPVPLKYIWQEDDGFRLAQIRNKCVAAAKGEYIIQIDGDIFLQKDFIADHLRHARRGHFLKGGRVQLNKKFSDRLCERRTLEPVTVFSTEIEAKRANTLRISPLALYLAPRYRKNRDNVLGCNMSFFREDFMAVNGYDENFEGWGGEDLDLAFRFRNYGLGKRYLKFTALGYHLWHREASKEHSARNHAIARANARTGIVIARAGVDRYVPKAAAAGKQAQADG